MVDSMNMDQALHVQLRDFRRTLHQHPELSGEEYETTKRIRAFLREHNIEPLNYALKTGALVLVQGKYPGPCVAVRADIDALPISEETGLPYKSLEHGKMHACGHDFHTTCALGALLRIKDAAATESSFAGSVLFIFQPAEEIGIGAKLVMDTGVFEDYQVKAIIGEHNNPLLEVGKIGVKAGPLMGSVDEFRVTVHGVGGHAAIPDLTVDPIVTAAHIVSVLQHIVSRNISPLHSAVLTIGQFHAGTARNVIPMEAVIEGTVRCLEPENRDKIEQRFRAFVEQTAASFGAHVDIEYERQLPAVVNDAVVAQIVQEAALTAVGEQAVVIATPTLAGEDFAIYQDKYPGCFFWVGTGRPDGTSKGWHHPQFDVEESMITVTSDVFVQAVFNLLHHFRTEIKA